MSARVAFGCGARRAAFALSVVVGLASTSCGADRRTPPAAPALESPSDAVPPELDFVIRLDVGRLRGALGTAVVTKIRGELRGGDGFDQFVLDALERTDVFVMAARFEDGDFKDGVIAAEGNYRGLDPRKYATDPPWEKPIDLGGDVRRYDRKKPKRRSDPARLYMRSDRLMVFASEATLDSLEAVIERHRRGNSVRPPERGIVSAAMRLRPGSNPFARGGRFPMFSEAFGGARSIEAWIDQSSVGFRMELVCELESEGEAKHAAALVEVARVAISEQKSRAAAVARHASAQAEGRHLLVRADLPLSVLGEMLGGVSE